MKSSRCVAIFGLMGIAAWILSADLLSKEDASTTPQARAAEPAPTGDQQPEKQEQASGGPPPLVIDKSAPLLLEDPAEQEQDPWAIPLGPVADNTACYCCHTNYEEEEFAVQHARANVGCVECHGQSYPHRNDENNITPPDVMFPPEKIEPNCRECHETHDAAARDVIARWRDRCAEKTQPEEILCMDCHGEHRLASRTVRWDKRTGKLITRDNSAPAADRAASGKLGAPAETKQPPSPDAARPNPPRPQDPASEPAKNPTPRGVSPASQ